MTFTTHLHLLCALIGAFAPGVLSGNVQLRGADPATRGGPFEFEWTRVHANGPQGTQGDKDSNGNPCYCNPPEKNSNKQCLAGYTCEKHKCVGPGPAGVCQESKDVDYVPEGGTCDIIAGKVCVEPLTCDDGICRQMGQKKAEIVPAGGACGAPDTVCMGDTECLDGFCRTPLVPAGGACAAGQVCVEGYQCVDGFCRIPLVPAGGACAPGQVCVAGYQCIDGFCQTPPVPAGGACAPGQVCVAGYQCVYGICQAPTATGTLPQGADCTNNKNGCQPGLVCLPSETNGSDRYFCNVSSE